MARHHDRYPAASAAALLLLGLALFLPMLGASFAYDDMDCLNYAADVLAGRKGYWAVVFQPHMEHVVALLRIAVHALLACCGLRAWPFRLLVFGAHVATAWLLGLVARACGGSSAAGWAAGVAYLLPGTAALTMVVQMAGAPFPMGLAALAAALALLACRPRGGGGRARLLAGACGWLAVGWESSLVPFLATPLLFDLYQRRGRWQAAPATAAATPRAGAAAAAIPTPTPLRPPAAGERGRRRRPAMNRLEEYGLALALGAAMLSGLATSWLVYRRLHLPGPAIDFRHGLPRALFLLAAAPFRYLTAGAPLAPSGSPDGDFRMNGLLAGCALGAGLALAAVLLWRQLPRALVVMTLCSAAGPVVYAVLVGLTRARFSYQELYETDRYFFPFLLPWSFFAGTLAAGLWSGLAPAGRERRGAAATAAAGADVAVSAAGSRPTAGDASGSAPGAHRGAVLAILLALGLCELALQRAGMLRMFPFDTHARHGVRCAQLGDLARRLNALARHQPAGSPPLELPDGDLWFRDVHNQRVSDRLLLAAAPRLALQLGGVRVDGRSQRALNPVLAAWGRQTGPDGARPVIVRGRLLDERDSPVADFRSADDWNAALGGLYPWEPGGRWATQTAYLRLLAGGPRLRLLLGGPPAEEIQRWPAQHRAIHLRVVGIDEATARQVVLATLAVCQPGEGGYEIDAAPLLALAGVGAPVRIALIADRAWRPVDVLPGSGDTRWLSVLIRRAALGPR